MGGRGGTALAAVGLRRGPLAPLVPLGRGGPGKLGRGCGSVPGLPRGFPRPLPSPLWAAPVLPRLGAPGAGGERAAAAGCAPACDSLPPLATMRRSGRWQRLPQPSRLGTAGQPPGPRGGPRARGVFWGFLAVCQPPRKVSGAGSVALRGALRGSLAERCRKCWRPRFVPL